jgi:hypothetical protein
VRSAAVIAGEWGTILAGINKKTLKFKEWQY